jgi:hypothetical protein
LRKRRRKKERRKRRKRNDTNSEICWAARQRSRGLDEGTVETLLNLGIQEEVGIWGVRML